MWDLSSLAQKAKEAVATIESEINNSVGYADAGVSSLFSDSTAATPASDNNIDADYFKVEEEEVSFSEADPLEKDNENTTLVEKATKYDDENVDSNNISTTTSSGILSKIEQLEKELGILKEELIAAREEAKSYRVRNLELEQQVRDLTEENMSLKMNISAKEMD